MTTLRMRMMMILIRMMIQFVCSEMLFEIAQWTKRMFFVAEKNALIRKMKENSFSPQQNLAFKENGTKYKIEETNTKW